MPLIRTHRIRRTSHNICIFRLIAVTLVVLVFTTSFICVLLLNSVVHTNPANRTPNFIAGPPRRADVFISNTYSDKYIKREQHKAGNNRTRTIPYGKNTSNDTVRDRERRDANLISKLRASHLTVDANKTAYINNKSLQLKYYTLRQERINPHDYEFLVHGEGICSNPSDPFLLILILSMHTHIDTREAIRKTWARVTTTGYWPWVGELGQTVKVAFLFGHGKTALHNNIVQQESKEYGDIVQADFVDSYYNLTRKIVIGLKWASLYCPKAKYILKADEDVFVHIPNLIRGVENKVVGDSGIMYGHTHEAAQVLRKGRWAVTKEMFPFETYPTYACGNTYLISGNIAGRVFHAAEYMPYLSIEDVFVTGIIRTIIDAKIVDVIGYTNWFEKKPQPCEFKNEVRISATKVDTGLQYFIWEGQKQKRLKDCYTPEPVKRDLKYKPERTRNHGHFRDEHIYYNKTSGKFLMV